MRPVCCVLVCAYRLHVCVCLASTYTSDCRRKGQQADMAITLVLSLRTSLCVSKSNRQQNSEPSTRPVFIGLLCRKSSYSRSLSQKAAQESQRWQIYRSIWRHIGAEWAVGGLKLETLKNRRQCNLFGLALIFPSDNTSQALCCKCFSFLPRENCVRFCKCILTDTSVWHVDRQLVWIKTSQGLEHNNLVVVNVFTEMYAHDNRKQKQVVLTVHSFIAENGSVA